MAKKTIKRPRIDSARVKSLFKSLKSITKVAAKVGASYAGVRNNLIRQKVVRRSSRGSSTHHNTIDLPAGHLLS